MGQKNLIMLILLDMSGNTILRALKHFNCKTSKKKETLRRTTQRCKKKAEQVKEEEDEAFLETLTPQPCSANQKSKS